MPASGQTFTTLAEMKNKYKNKRQQDARKTADNHSPSGPELNRKSVFSLCCPLGRAVPDPPHLGANDPRFILASHNTATPFFSGFDSSGHRPTRALLLQTVSPTANILWDPRRLPRLRERKTGSAPSPASSRFSSRIRIYSTRPTRSGAARSSARYT